MKHLRTVLFAAVLSVAFPSLCKAQKEASVSIFCDSPSGTIDPMIYGQLFEHIYFSPNNGVWNEMIFERSFEPEQYPGIHPRDGYFDGWFMDDEGILHSPTRYEQPLEIVSLDTDSYVVEMDVNWRSYRLARRAWSGGLMDIRFAFRNGADGEPYYARIHNPYYEVRSFNPGQTESQAQAAAVARAREAMQKQSVTPAFSIDRMAEKEMSFFGQTRTIRTLVPIVSRDATEAQINENQDWHHLRIESSGRSARMYWDGVKVLSCPRLDATGHNDIVFWVNYTEATYRNIRVTSPNGRTVYFEGTPEDVKTPSIAQQWTAFGEAEYSLVKGDAINMDYSQRISVKSAGGVLQGPQNVVEGENYIGSIYAKGDGALSVGFRTAEGDFVSLRPLGIPGPGWRRYEFELPSNEYSGDADFAILVEDGTVHVDAVSLMSRSGKELGGFRPDIFKAVDDLHPTCMRWPGGGYAAQYDWRWGIGPQEQRRRWDHWMWMDYDQNCFGTDEFIRFCREIGSEPVIVVSVAFERPASEYDSILENACNWLRYCNEPATGEWGRVRAANGHPEPYNVKYWEIDNEMWEMGIERYEKCVRDFSTAMRAIDPDIRIIACGGFQEDEAFLQRSGNYFDYLSLHHYEGENGYATGPAKLGEQYDRYASMIAACPNPNIKLFISEWNLQSIDWRTGLFAGGFLNMCETKDVVAMGAAALFIRRTDSPDWNNAFINFDYKDVFVAPNYQVTELWYDYFSRYRLAYEGDTGDLSISTTMSEDGRNVVVKVVNASEEPYSLALHGSWPAGGGCRYEYFAPGDLKTANSMEHKDAVALKTSSSVSGEGVLVVDIEPLSAGVISIPR